MSISDLMMTVAVVTGLSATAAAQTASNSANTALEPTDHWSAPLQSVDASANVTRDTGSKASVALAQQPSPTQVAHTGIETNNHWFASGFLGPNFGSGGSAALTNTNTGQTISGGFESGRD